MKPILAILALLAIAAAAPACDCVVGAAFVQPYAVPVQVQAVQVQTYVQPVQIQTYAAPVVQVQRFAVQSYAPVQVQAFNSYGGVQAFSARRSLGFSGGAAAVQVDRGLFRSRAVIAAPGAAVNVRTGLFGRARINVR